MFGVDRDGNDTLAPQFSRGDRSGDSLSFRDDQEIHLRLEVERLRKYELESITEAVRARLGASNAMELSVAVEAEINARAIKTVSDCIGKMARIASRAAVIGSRR